MARRDQDESNEAEGLETTSTPEPTGSEIAIIGMACRFPGASTIDAFWRNLRDGVESLSELTDEELLAAGVPPELLKDPSYVRRASVIENIEDFDARFFGYAPQEATIMDPQHRLFLECAWEVLEQGGYDPGRIEAPIGVFTGAKTNTYLFNVVAERHRFPTLDNFQIALGNDLAAMATRVSYKFDLRGPSYALHTACSTSLITVHLACQSLLLDECSMAIAGGASINVPQKKGYPYQKGGILSPDGSCRTFDADAAGSNFGNGVGAVLLKRLDDAVADGDHIFAVIRGSAANNDGARKASFTAPGVEGQTAVLLEAMAVAGVEAEDLSYIEAHGTATDLGDSIEMLALNQAFRASTAEKHFCAIGSAKTNLGHLEAAAGIAGLIKTALALEHRELPASLHFERPNPKIDFDASPFEVNTQLRAWPELGKGRKRIAGVSSFGIGSTNAHVILEEPPAPAPSDPDRAWQLVLVSAQSESARESISRDLGEHLAAHEDVALADAAFTLALGRKPFEHRRAIVARDREEAAKALCGEGGSLRDATLETADRGTAFLLPGLGEHSLEMGLGLYQREAVFREALDELAEAFRPHLGEDLREVLYPRGTDAEETGGGGRGEVDLKAMLGRGGGKKAGENDGAEDEATSAAQARLDRTRFTQPAIFAVEVALARLFASRGISPQALLGFSLGEYVSAHLAGVLSLEDACCLVARRAALIDELPEGAMLAVTLDEAELVPHLEKHGLSLSAVNGRSGGSVAAGETERIEALAAELAEKGVSARRLPTTHAFHSSMMEPVAEELTKLVAGFELRAPETPWVSNVTGTWITAEEATDPAYWARHLVSPVRFADALATLLDDGGRALLEVGPGQGLTSFARLHPDCGKERAVIPTMGSRHGKASAAAAFLGALGDLWLAGVEVDWTAHYAVERRRRVPLPTYPFERKRYWIDPDPATLARTDGREVPADAAAVSQGAPVKIPDIEKWLYRQVWRTTTWPEPAGEKGTEGAWLLLADGDDLDAGKEGVAGALAEKLREHGADVLLATPGDGFARVAGEDGDVYRLRPGHAEDFEELLAHLAGRRLRRVVHLLNAAPVSEDAGGDGDAGEATFRAAQERGFYSLIALVQALGRKKAMSGGLEIDLVSHGVHEVEEDDPLAPERSTLLGPAVVIPQEHPNLLVRTIDVDRPGSEKIVERLLTELLGGAEDLVVVHRGDERRVRAHERLEMPAADKAHDFRQEGVYLVTGGLGGIGLALAEHLAKSVRARLVLTRRTPLPPREEWDDWLAAHGGADAGEGEGENTDKTSRAIVRVRALEEAGAEVIVAAADVADETAMRAVVEGAVERFGTIHGVIHAAGVLDQDSFKTVQLTGREECELHFGPKAYGLYVLGRVLEDLEPDFVTLYSSLSAILGGLGYVGYATANLFMDYFAARQNRRLGGAVWQSVDWDSWHYTDDENARGGLGTTLSELAMTPSEGVETLRRLLAIESPRHLVISTGELAPRLAQWVELRALRAAAAGPGDDAGAGATRARRSRKKLSAGDDLEGEIAGVWRRVLGVEEVGREENFFDLGGNSLLGMQLVAELGKDFGVEVEPVALFESPTVASMARFLSPEAEEDTAPKRRFRRRTEHVDIAVIGLEGRFPGAETAEQFWQNLRAGRETISFFSDEELRRAGVDDRTLADPQYVKARPILNDVELFDAPFFGYTPREAEIMDPQHRLFLETSWAAFENAGYDIESYDGAVGVYAGASISSYMANLYSNPDLVESVGTFQTLIGNEKDSLTTKVSYKFNLRGPSLAVQTFCSTSLVATHLACQALLNGECDMALAGGVSVIVPQVSGYRYEKGGIGSLDGHIRTFDAKGSGIVFGNGLGAVVLKRLDDALADGDPIRAVIKATAINNDGSGKAGYSATSVEGQAEVVAAALEISGVNPETIGYMEAHGTGTPLGDPIEMAAVNKAFRPHTDQRRFCPIGSAKTNVGHLDRAAGVTGLIKTILALEHAEIPPSLHFEDPNPAIDFEDNAFRVVTELTPWPKTGDLPRRAGVNSLGLGGTNAHAVLEEAPEREPSSPGAPWQLLPLSARTGAALDRLGENLAAHLETHPDQSLADVAYTLQIGRKAFDRRRVAVVAAGKDGDADHAAAAELLKKGQGPGLAEGRASEKEPRIVFLFPGLGGQYVGMGRELYDTQPVFRDVVDRCAEILEAELGFDLREILYPEETAETKETAETNKDGTQDAPSVDLRRMLGRGGGNDDASAGTSAGAGRLNETAVAQPVLFVIEMALARLLASWGIVPSAMIGYSLGEYAAACVGGMLGLEDALRLVARRAKLIDGVDGGAMLAVPLAAEAVEKRLEDERFAATLSLAAVNGPEQSVVAGPGEEIDAFAADLAEDDVVSRRLQTTHAFHSSMMDEIYEPFLERLGEVDFSAPEIPWLSNVTGTFMSAEEAADTTYWARHMRTTVRFSGSLEVLAKELLGEKSGETVLVELGPGQTLGSLALQHPAIAEAGRPPAMAAMRHDYENRPDLAHLLDTVGRLWTHGAEVDWLALHGVTGGGGARRLRVALPTYSFDRQAYWVEAKVHGYTGLARVAAATDAVAEGALINLPSWRRVRAPRRRSTAALGEILDPALERFLLLADPADGGVAESLAAGLRAAGRKVVLATPGDVFAAPDDSEGASIDGGSWTIRPGDADDARALVEALGKSGDGDGNNIDALVHLWSLAAPGDEDLENAQRRGLDGLLAMLRALGADAVPPKNVPKVWTVSAAAHEVAGDEPLRPNAASILAATRVLPREWASAQSPVQCRGIDLVPPSNGSAEILGARLLAEIAEGGNEVLVAYRGAHRWVPHLEPLSAGDAPSILEAGGAYLLTGGLGSRGYAFADFLVRRGGEGVRLALVETPDEAAEERRERRRAALEEAGAQLRIFEADPTDEAAFTAAVGEATAWLGHLDGLVHAAEPAGVGAAYVTIDESADEAAAAPGRALLTARADGARHLAATVEAGLASAGDTAGDTAAEPPAFALLLASTATLHGGLGLLYDAASGFVLDAFAARGSRRGEIPWTSLAWDFFLDDADDSVRSPGLAEEEDRAEALQEVILDSLFRLLPATQLVATPRSLAGWNHLETTASTSADDDAETDTASTGGLYPRPELSTAYAEPTSDTERRLAEIWESMLGVTPVGIHDGFLELGGDSLLAARLVARMREVFELDLPVRLFFEASTVAQLAEEVDRRLEEKQAEEEGDVAELMAMLDDLSDEEIEAELAKRGVGVEDE